MLQVVNMVLILVMLLVGFLGSCASVFHLEFTVVLSISSVGMSRGTCFI